MYEHVIFLVATVARHASEQPPAQKATVPLWHTIGSIWLDVQARIGANV